MPRLRRGFYAVLGSSKHLIAGPMAVTAALSAAAIVGIGETHVPFSVTLASAVLLLRVGLLAIVSLMLHIGPFR